jgi:hypothetical protein
MDTEEYKNNLRSSNMKFHTLYRYNVNSAETIIG